MTTPKLPILRLTNDDECVLHEKVSVDIPSNGKFSVSYAPADPRQVSSPPSVTSMQDHGSLSSTDDEQHTSDGDSGEDYEFPPDARDSSYATTANSYQFVSRRPETSPKQTAFISRTLSMPLPSQLSQLENPHRPGLAHSYHSSAAVTQSAQVDEISKELGDSLQMAIQTMLQISPFQVLDPAKEQFSACALSVPTSSMSAMFTAMKNLNYISANMAAFCEQSGLRLSNVTTPERPSDVVPHNEFDVGEMVQCVGDALSGVMAQSGVDLVLYHGDVGLKQVYVYGDESGLSFALSHIVRQVLKTAQRGDSVEIGLLVSTGAGDASEATPIEDLSSSINSGSGAPLQCVIRVSHKYVLQTQDQPRDVLTTEYRPRPEFSTLFLRRILRQLNGSLVSDLPPPESFTTGRTCELRLELLAVPPPQSTPPGNFAEDTEPSFQRLSSFGETLKGKRVTLYADTKGSFAHRLTSYLTTWGMDVSHVSPDGQVDGLADTLSSPSTEARTLPSPLPTYFENASGTIRPSAETRQSPPEPPTFIVIDDDIDILKERMQALRFEQPPQGFPVASRRRPTLSSRKSSPQVARILGLNTLSRLPSPFVVMHFTSLSNYKLLKDVVQSMVTTYAGSAIPLPEVMIIPKPAGPRRILTALYTAITKPALDPLFSPIATSPMTPGAHNLGYFIPSPISENQPGTNGSSAQGTPTSSPALKNSNRPGGSRSNSDRSAKSVDGVPGNPTIVPTSPLAMSDSVEYFSVASEKLGASPSSGLLIQSPNGQPAGIFFHPKSRTVSRNPSDQSVDREKGLTPGHLPSRRGSTSRLAPTSKKEELVTFASLHEASANTEMKTIPASVAASKLAAITPPAPDPLLTLTTSISRRPSDESRKTGSPGASPTLSRRAGKRPATESGQPTPQPKPKPRPLAAVDNSIVPPIKVLIVDDNPINQTILSTFMRRKKIKYELASNGQEAVQKWRTGGFHLILMDIQMPVMDGIQATKEIRRYEKVNAGAGFPPMTPSADGHTSSESSGTSNETRSLNSPYRSSVIIVALTASSLQSDRVAALAAGCNDFLTKPVSLLWLNNKIIEWGSIKALQMWADIRPDIMATVTSNQAAQARNIAERLYVPAFRKTTPSPTRRTAIEDNAAALALANSGGPPLSAGVYTPNIPAALVPVQPSSQSSSLESAGAPPNVLDSASIAGKSVESDGSTDPSKPGPSSPRAHTSEGTSTEMMISQALIPVFELASDSSPPKEVVPQPAEPSTHGIYPLVPLKRTRSSSPNSPEPLRRLHPLGTPIDP